MFTGGEMSIRILISLVLVCIFSFFAYSMMKKPEQKQTEIWISLTTIPSRLSTLPRTLASLKNQTLPADRINLCIPRFCKKENKPYELPAEILNDPKISIVYCEKDYGPSTKLLGSLSIKSDPETIIITVDDDVIYPTDLIEKLVRRSEMHPNAAIGFCGWNVKDLLDGREQFYNNLVHEDRRNDLSFMTRVDVLEGFRGILTKRKFWDETVFDYSKAPKGAFYVDDVWISGHLEKRDVPRLAFKYDENRTLTNTETYYKIWPTSVIGPDNDSLCHRSDFFLCNQETARYFWGHL